MIGYTTLPQQRAPQPVWGLSGTDDRRDLYGSGHQMHWIHFNHSMRKPSVIIPVTAAVDDDGLVQRYLETATASLGLVINSNQRGPTRLDTAAPCTPTGRRRLRREVPLRRRP